MKRKIEKVEYISTNEAAELLGVSSRTIRKLIETGYMKVLDGIILYRIVKDSFIQYQKGVYSIIKSSPAESLESLSEKPLSVGKRYLLRRKFNIK